MALTTALIQNGAAGIATSITQLSLHTADPGSTGTNETSAARKTVTATSSAGVVTVPSTAFTGGAASGACTFAGLWAGSTFLGGVALTGDQTFNAAGAYTVNSLTITGS